MFTYYLCDDNETIYRIELSIKPEEKKYYLSLLENYLTEMIFIEEKELKKIVKEEAVEEENSDDLSIEDNCLFLKKTIVTGMDRIEDYLPLIVTVKTKRYFFLRSYTIFMLIKLLSDELNQIDSLYAIKTENLLNNFNYIDFSLIYTIFFNQFGTIINKKIYDYNSLMNLLRSVEVKVTEKYSKSELSTFWQGDEAERCLAEGIVSDSKANKEAIITLKRTVK